MTRLPQLAVNASFVSMLSSLLLVPASGQESRSIGERYGIGAAGTIGRGTYILPDGPWYERTEKDKGRPFVSFGFGQVSRSYTSSTGYRSATIPRPVLPAPQPYLTSSYFEPGDGYRYPLYYNPSTRSYFYYPRR